MTTSLSLSELTAAHVDLSEYKQKEINQAIDQANTISEFMPAFPMFAVSVAESGECYFEYSEVRLKHPFLNVLIQYNSRNKKYHVFTKDTARLPYVSHSDIDKAKALFSEPNQIGVLNTKKLQNWIAFLEDVYNHCKNISEAKTKAVEDFKNSIKDLPVKWNQDKKSGEIIKNGLEYRFTITDSGFIDQRIEIRYTVSKSLENFLRLSDNNFDK